MVTTATTMVATSSARCFIIEDNVKRFQLNNLESFGKLVYLYQNNSRDVSIWHENFPKKVVDRLEDFGYNPNVDYLVVIGNMVPLVRAIGEMVLEYGCVRVLFFDAKDREYLSYEIGDKNE